jgi:beta-lactamase regulating signal transducer with metallopeptidase domain
MQITIFSFMTSLVCFSLFFLFFSMIKGTRFLMSNGLFLVMALITLCFIRLVFSFEFAFAIILPSIKVLPVVLKFLGKELFVFYGFHVTVSVIAVAIWLTVSAVLFIRLANGLVKHHIMLHSLTPVSNTAADRIMSEIVSRTKPRKKYKLICSNEILIPMVSGFFTPTICIPAMPFSDVELESILSHEWNHFLHKDIWIKLLFYIVRVVLWWNPLCYLLFKDLNQLLEIRCDIKNTTNKNEIEKVEYLESILSVIKSIEFSGRKLPVDSVAFIGDNHSASIKQRFNIVLGYKRRSSRIKNIVICGAMVFILLSSYGVIIQSVFEPPYNDAMISDSDINSESSYIVVYQDGTYECYIDGICMGAVGADAVADKPFSELPHIKFSDCKNTKGGQE